MRDDEGGIVMDVAILQQRIDDVVSYCKDEIEKSKNEVGRADRVNETYHDARIESFEDVIVLLEDDK